MKKQPYKYWTREELHKHLMRQAEDHKVERLTDKISVAVYSKLWDPIEQFNGCNVVQDDFHPFVPCFIHDYDWIVLGGGKKYDKDFVNNLLSFGMHPSKALIYYIGIRIAWLFYYKWKK